MAYHSNRLGGHRLVLQKVLLLILLVRLVERSNSRHVRKQARWDEPVYRHGDVGQPIDPVWNALARELFHELVCKVVAVSKEQVVLASSVLRTQTLQNVVHFLPRVPREPYVDGLSKLHLPWSLVPPGDEYSRAVVRMPAISKLPVKDLHPGMKDANAAVSRVLVHGRDVVNVYTDLVWPRVEVRHLDKDQQQGLLPLQEREQRSSAW
mmetsp:Transcript_722/g.2140  ORF Transcript_722/g.2140 Transcript_722/m.2140 type:complete len:208 (+) Transcript_722:2110-2733(+)